MRNSSCVGRRRAERLLWVSRHWKQWHRTTRIRSFQLNLLTILFLQSFTPVRKALLLHPFYRLRSVRCRKQLGCAHLWSWWAVHREPGPRPSTPESRVLDAPLGSCISKACCAEGITEANRGTRPAQGGHHIHACPGEDDIPRAPGRGQESAGSPLQPNPCSHRPRVPHNGWPDKLYKVTAVPSPFC